MKLTIINFVVFLIFTTSLSAQFGISARIQNTTNKTWNTTYQNAADTTQNLFSRSYEYGINYWFRLKEYRIEFLPEITMAKSEESMLHSSLDVTAHKRTSYNFNFNVQVYPLDFLGDCNCPTFSKDGNLISKGFYWLFSPGLTKHTIDTEFTDLSPKENQSASITSLRFGVGAGVDVGLTDLITISPFIQYSMNFGNGWTEQYAAYDLPLPENESNRSNINQWHFGLRLSFRPDYKN